MNPDPMNTMPGPSKESVAMVKYRMPRRARGLTALLVLSAVLLNAQAFLQYRQTIPLDRWKFHKGEMDGAESGDAIDETPWQDVRVPHTWNAKDVLTDGPEYYQGVGWYRTSFTLDRDDRSVRHFIRFEGASLVADVFINGHYLGTHKGGYSAFCFELTPFLRDGEVNRLSVRASNAMQMDVAPSGTALYPVFGGIYRPVVLFGTDDLCISPLDHASSGVFISPVTVRRESADFDVQTLVDWRPAPVIQTQSPELLPPKGRKGRGLWGEYFENPEFKGKAVHSRVDGELSFEYGYGGPYPDMPVDGFSIRWTGRFIPKKTGTYRFLLTSDDGSRLILDGKTVIDHWGRHAAAEKTADIRLDAGKETILRIEYNEIGGAASIRFGWARMPEANAARAAFLSTVIADRDGNTVTMDKKAVSIRSSSNTPVFQRLKIQKPRLWDAKRDPYLYTARIALTDSAGRVLDRLDQPLGLRYFRVDRDSGLILNGRPYPLYGVCRHQEWEGLGPALSDSEHERDFELIREIGANGIRFAHYQQADILYRLCDENGLVAWAEIPNTPAYRGNVPGYLDNCRDQLIELVKQNFNHPAILFWGLYNEIDIPARDVRLLNRTVKQIDPDRLTTQADFTQPQERHGVTDVAAWNWYFGWYYGNFGDYRPWYDRLHAEHPEIIAGLSEYGAEACTGQQQENPERPDPLGRFFPEQYQSQYHEQVWTAIKDRKDIWCKFVWNMFDFSWTHAVRGEKPFMNFKGLVTHDRRIKKDAFYFYKANWSDEPTLHILGRRNAERTEKEVPVSVYTNLESAALYVNGELVSEKRTDSDIRKLTWDHVRLKPGLNLIGAVGTRGGKTYTDQCEWRLKL
jgi:hypothetical protein